MKQWLGVIAVVAACGTAFAADWPGRAPEQMGLPTRTDGHLEVRVWLGGGIAHPFRLVRVWETDDGVRGEQVAWSSSPDKSVRRFMKREYCDGPLQRAGDIVWCRLTNRASTNWELLLADLDPNRLWELPLEETLGEKPCVVEDGEIVAIELVSGSRRHQVAYGNPDWCCRWPACAIASHVREIVRRLN